MEFYCHSVKRFFILHYYVAIIASSGCTTGDLRLVDGNNMFEGRVEICRDGVWGTVTEFGWNFADARVTCRQLGYSSECKHDYNYEV